MGKVKDKNLDEIFKRSTAEKLVVVESLWENIRNEVADEGTTKDELDLANERREEYKKNPSKVKKWVDIKKDYFKKKK